MLYVCKACNYKTENHAHLVCHNSTKKHLENSDTSEKHDRYTCRICGNKFGYKSSYIRHIKTVCATTDDKHNKVAEVIVLKHELQKEVNTRNELEKKIEILKLENDFEKKLAEQKDLSSKEKDEIRLDHNNYLKNLVVQAGNIVNTSISSLSFLRTNYDTAPLLGEIPNYNKLLKNGDNRPLEDVLMQVHKYKRVDDFVCQILVDNYKKENPREQSTWNTDPERRTYIIRGLVSGQPDWVTDKRGERFKALTIDPLLVHLKNVIVKKINIVMTTPDTPEKAKKMESMAELIGLLSDSKFASSIVGKMCHHLYLDQSKKLITVNPIDPDDLINSSKEIVALPLDVDKLDIDDKIVDKIIDELTDNNNMMNEMRESIKNVEQADKERVKPKPKRGAKGGKKSVQATEPKTKPVTAPVVAKKPKKKERPKTMLEKLLEDEQEKEKIELTGEKPAPFKCKEIIIKNSKPPVVYEPPPDSEDNSSDDPDRFVDLEKKKALAYEERKRRILMGGKHKIIKTF